jgi:hypothetical protein
LIKLLSSCYVSKIVATQNEYKTKKRKGELKMKKILLTIVAGMLMTANVMAQEANQNRPERRQMDPKEMVKQRTNETVEKYKLSEEQAAKLLELNTKYMGKIPMGPMAGMRGQGRRPQGQMGQMPQRPQRPQNDTVQGRRPQMGQMGQMGNREEMRKNMEAYSAELKTILTEEQYQAYTKDQQNRFQGQRGQRPRRDINNNN